MNNIADLLKVLRVKQWIKNLFIFASLIFGQQFVFGITTARVIMCFAAFCLVSSALYIVNDICDRRRDALHPEKSKRPIVSGRVSVRAALFIVLLLSVAAVLIIIVIGNRERAVVVFLYAAINILYNLIFKNIVIMDVMVISLGFELRVWAGAVIIGIVPSAWLQVCTFLIALFISFAKRRSELFLLRSDAQDHRKVLSVYRVEFLDQAINICAGVVLVSYVLYTLSSDVLARPYGHRMIYTTPFVIYGICRYLLIVHNTGFAGDPTEALLKDRPLFFACMLWLCAVLLCVYVNR